MSLRRYSLSAHCFGLQDMEEELVGLCDELDRVNDQFNHDHFERSTCFKAELIGHMKEYMLTLQVAEERKQQLERAVEDAEALHEFFDAQV